MSNGLLCIMDRFYLTNRGLYEKLVELTDTSAPAPHFSRHTSAAPREVIEEAREHPNMTIAARIRPMLGDDIVEGFPCAVYPRTTQAEITRVVDIHDLYNHPKGRPQLRVWLRSPGAMIFANGASIQSNKYRVDRVFGELATTDEMYFSIVEELVVHASNGGIATLLAYGQTGSGKTFTISQLQRLAVASLIDRQSVLLNESELYIAVFDLAGNSAFDLLASRKPVQVLEDSSGVTHLAGATEYRIDSKKQALDLLDRATSFRRTESTRKNDVSSRSHSICRIRIAHSANSGCGESVLYMVDLAGSEAARDVAEHGADRMRETREINISLSALKDCLRSKANIETAVQKGRRGKVFVPVRRSTLTRVLKHVFEPVGSVRGMEKLSKTVFIACVNPSLADVGPSKNTMRYAEMLVNG